MPETAITTTTTDKQDTTMEPRTIACLGGGQLGRMMALEAPRLNLRMVCLEGSTDCPASVAARIVPGSLKNAHDIQNLVNESTPTVITTEIEHINCDALLELEENQNYTVQPSGHVIQLIQDKYRQKQHFRRCGIAVPDFVRCANDEELQQACQTLGGVPIMLKARTGAYDGRGNAVLAGTSPAEVQAALQQLGVHASNDKDDAPYDLYAERMVDFDCEIAVMVVRSSHPETYPTICYPAVHAIQASSICRLVLAPARIPHECQRAAQALAIQAVDCLPRGASGVFGVELFVLNNGKTILLNEIAPRPHNTGHYTQSACVTSQFENHLRAISGMPLGSTSLCVPAAAMVNVLGKDSMEETYRSSKLALKLPQTSVHWYGKQENRRGRKMGHINITGDSQAELDAVLYQILDAEGIDRSVLPNRSTTKGALVGVIMGSQSDLPTMQAAVNILKEFNVPYQVDIVSAHRTPEKLMEYGKGASSVGLRVIIAGAGGAAHLPGMVASLTELPVIGVPVKTSTLSGVDSLYSIVQMPRGIPVATVAIGNAQNAGLLAVRILSTSRPELRLAMREYQTNLKEMVESTSERLLELGSDEYLAQMENKNQSVNV